MSVPFMQFYVADYLGDTRHLTTEQHGAYLLLLMTMWRAGGTLPNDPKKLARLVGCTPSRWARIEADVIAFFSVEGESIINKRLTLELKKASEKSNQRAVVGSLGGKAKALKDKETGLAKATDLLWHSSESESESKIEAKASCPVPPHKASPSLFEDGWKAYPSKGRERSKSQVKTRPVWREAAKAAGSEERLLAAIKRYVAKDETHKGECGPPAFDRWLRDGRWEHWLPAEGNVVSIPEMSPELIARRRALMTGE